MDIDKQIISIFNEIGLKKDRKGYFLWCDLIHYVYTNFEYFNLYRISAPEYYDYLIKKHGGDYWSIERALRYIISSKKNEIEKYFRYYEKISNKIFIVLMYEKLKEIEKYGI